MTKDKPRRENAELPSIDLRTLETVSGGVNWKYYAYQAGFAMSKWDPSQVAANFIM
jgi:hypothetical protein